MSKKLYALVFTESSIPMDFTIYDSFEEALRKYIEYSLHETRRLLIAEEGEGDEEAREEVVCESSDEEGEEGDDDIDEDEDDLSCAFQVLERCDPSTEYTLLKEYDMDYFLEEFIGSRDNVETYLSDLEKVVADDSATLPQEVLDAFTPK